MKRLQKIIEVALDCAATLAAASAIGLWVQQSWLLTQSAAATMGTTAARAVALPSGVLWDGGRYSRSSARGCTAVRISSVWCLHCWNDEAAWERIAARARAVGCEAVALAPNPSDAPPAGVLAPGGIPDLKYIGLEWAANGINVRMVPATLLIDDALHIRWSHAGELAVADVNSALSVLQSGPR